MSSFIPLVLGTAQFGGAYGIVNTYGCPSDEDVRSILECAEREGINFIDTALSYGDSLERFSRLCPQNYISKIQMINKFSVKDDLEEVYVKLLNYLRRTGLKRFYGLLIHDFHNLTPQKEKEILSFLKKVKDNHLVERVGVSVYAPSDLDAILDIYPIDLIQCPINLFDQRFLAEDILRQLSEKNVEIHARSIFLQGVLLSDKLPPVLKNLQFSWDLYQNFLAESGLSSLEFIMTWIKQIKGIHKWLIGINTKNEISQILRAYNTSNNIFDYDWAKLNIPDNSGIDPRNWGLK